MRAPIGTCAFLALACCSLSSVLWAGAARAETIPFWDVQWSSPVRLSAGVGLVTGKRGDGFSTVRNAPLLQVEAGLGGGALHVGWVPFSSVASGLQFAGLAVKGSILRTWGSPSGVEPRRTFAGASIHAAWVVKLSLGVLAPIDGGHGGAVLTWAVGVGL